MAPNPMGLILEERRLAPRFEGWSRLVASEESGGQGFHR